MRSREYWIFCDESVQKGAHYSDFYGGVIVPAQRHADVENALRIRKAQIGFLKELKWQRVSEMWLDGYRAMVTAFFDHLRSGDVRMRVMFRKNEEDPERPVSLGDDRYFKLYYQFIKHAFGLAYVPDHEGGTRLRLYFDQLPHTREKVEQFKGFLQGLPEAHKLRHAKLHIDRDHITEVDSREHVLMQCVDIVTGAMAFRLNELHLARPEGQRIRGKRTLAKDRLYRHILREIRSLKPHLNPKISTAARPFPQGAWSMPYRHWVFKAR